MHIKFTLSTVFVVGAALSCIAEDEPKSKPIELEMLKATVGVWDAEVEVWPAGLESPPIKFKGVETNRLFGEHWVASDFESEFMVRS